MQPPKRYEKWVSTFGEGFRDNPSPVKVERLATPPSLAGFVL